MHTRVRTVLAAAGGGDERAWDGLSTVRLDDLGDRSRPSPERRRRGGCDADNLAALLTHLDQLKDPDCVGAWLATTARRECLRLLGQARSIVPYGDEPPEPEAGDQDPTEGLEIDQRDTALWRSFLRLRHSDQTLLRLLIADPAPSYEAMSAALEIPVGSIGPTRARALERLARELRRDGTLALLRA